MTTTTHKFILQDKIGSQSTPKPATPGGKGGGKGPGSRPWNYGPNDPSRMSNLTRMWNATQTRSLTQSPDGTQTASQTQSLSGLTSMTFGGGGGSGGRPPFRPRNGKATDRGLQHLLRRLTTVFASGGGLMRTLGALGSALPMLGPAGLAVGAVAGVGFAAGKAISNAGSYARRMGPMLPGVISADVDAQMINFQRDRAIASQHPEGLVSVRRLQNAAGGFWDDVTTRVPAAGISSLLEGPEPGVWGAYKWVNHIDAKQELLKSITGRAKQSVGIGAKNFQDLVFDPLQGLPVPSFAPPLPKLEKYSTKGGGPNSNLNRSRVIPTPKMQTP